MTGPSDAGPNYRPYIETAMNGSIESPFGLMRAAAIAPMPLASISPRPPPDAGPICLNHSPSHDLRGARPSIKERLPTAPTPLAGHSEHIGGFRSREGCHPERASSPASATAHEVAGMPASAPPC